VTFSSAFEEFFDLRRQHLSNGKHVAQWQTTMQRYVFPAIGERAIDDIEQPRSSLSSNPSGSQSLRPPHVCCNGSAPPSTAD
jgi:hypothetical protein